MKCAFVVASVALFAVADAFQLAAKHQATAEDGWQFRYLDENEVAIRGSFCMDGSAPGFWFKEGTDDTKWTISFPGGLMACYDDESCLALAKVDSSWAKAELELFNSGDFANYNHVQFLKCDGGIFMGDSIHVAGGQTMYLRGKRILDHTFDTLKSNTTFGSATQVMLTGGSGGGHTVFLVADYVKTMMPASVKKYGAVPMSGWYARNPEKLEYVFNLHQMQGVVAPGCAAAMSSEQHKCLEPENSYKYSETPMFVVQMLDGVSLSGAFDGNETLSTPSTDARDACLLAKPPHCDNDDAALLENYLDDFVGTIQSTSKYNRKGEGGFLSTCTRHIFYEMDDYRHYANRGVTVEDAVSNWWENLGNSAAKWHLPCNLNVDQPNNLQCEPSCHYDTE